MPKRTDIHTILIIGAGPIIIGQACEFDYSGTQACKALREENYRVVLINSNPATIMTDPEFADRTYIEPITPECVEKIIAREVAEMKRLGAKGKLALLPTLGGQTALNTAMALFRRGTLEAYSVEMIGANAQAIERGEDRQIFKELMLKIGLDVPISGIAHNIEEARTVAEKIGRFPLIIRPAFTLGGTGGGIAYNREEFEVLAKRGCELSPVSEILIEESLLGWKEYEMEVMRDHADNCVIICSIENFDPMGVHTGDSITVAPIQTLTDKEYQIMRDASFAVIREIGVETGGSNIQFGVNPENGRMVIIEMNPRVSRSSALASKATGFPIAKIAAKLAVGYLLDEIKNDITRETPASFEPTIDYVVVKVPRFAFEKFPQADPTLNTQMKSVGEAMSIGRTFKESLQKCLRSLEIGRSGLGGDGKPWRIGTELYGDRDILPADLITRKLSIPNADRIFFIRHAFRAGFTRDQIFQLTRIDPWFLAQIKEIVDLEEQLAASRNSGRVCSMRILIIGCGYVGLPLGERLVKAGHEVFGLRRNISGLASHAIRPLQADITQPATLKAIELNHDAVINLVSSTRGGPEEYRRVYLEGTANILQWLQQRPPSRYLYTSSTSVYSQTDSSWVTESSPTNPGSVTSRVLVETEKLLQSCPFALTLRVGGIYGPARGHLFHQYLRGEATLRDNGSSYINNIHLQDVTAAIMHLLSAGTPGETYNLVDNEPITQLTFFQWLSKELGKPLPPSAPADPNRKRGITNKRVSNAKLRSSGYTFLYPTFREGYLAEMQALGII